MLLKTALMICLTIFCYPACADGVIQPSTVEGNSHFIVAGSKNIYPYQYLGTDGKADGLMIDIWQLWAKKNGYTLEFRLTSWADSLQQLKSGQVDFHAGMAITDERKKNLLMGLPLLSLRTHIFVHHQLGGVHSLADIQPYVVGVVEGSHHISSLIRQLPGIHLKTYKNTKDLYQAALEGEVKIFTGLNQIPDKHADFIPLSQLFPRHKKITDKSYDLSYAVNPGFPRLAEKIQQGLGNISAAELRELERRWLVGSESDAVVIALAVDMAPYASISNKGEPVGLFVDIWRRWAEENQQKIDFLSDSNQLSMKNLMDNKADVYMAYAGDPVNSGRFNHAHHIYSFYSKIYFLKNGTDKALNPQAKGPLTSASINQATLGVLSSNPAKNALLKRFDDLKLVLFDSREAMVAACLSRQIDGFVAVQEIINFHLLKHNRQTRFAEVPDLRFESKVYALVAKQNSALIRQIKAGFGKLTLNELEAMEKAWVEHSDALYFAAAKTKVNLTLAEKNWLLKHPVIRLGAQMDWAPVEFIDDNGRLIGITADLMAIIGQRTGISFEVVLFDQWSQMLEALKNKEIDMLGSMTQTVERKRFSIFSDSYKALHWALVSSAANGKITVVKALKGKRLAVVEGYQISAYLAQYFPEISLYKVTNNKSGFAAVLEGKADAFIGSMVATASELKAGEYRSLHFSLIEDIEPMRERFGVRNDWQPLVGILNRVLVNISAADKKRLVDNWFKIKIESGIDKEKVLQFGAMGIVVLVIILIWNRRLKAEIRLRRLMEIKMKHMATHDELTGLPNRLLLRDRLNSSIASHARRWEHLALLFIDLDGFKAVNDSHGHHAGDELLFKIGERFTSGVRKSDTVARCGGDEFVVLLTGLHNSAEAAMVCDKILRLVKQPFELSNCTVYVGASIGVAMYPEDGNNDEDLLTVADLLMYKVKTSGKNDYRFSETVLNADMAAE